MERPLAIDVAGSLAPLFAWLLVLSFISRVPPLAATGGVLLAGLLFASRYLLASGDAEQIERRARSRAQPLGPQLPWAIVTAVAMSILLFALVALYERLVPAPTPIDDAADLYLKQPLSWLPIAVALVGVGPMVEQVVCFGWIQGRISREHGPETAIVNAAAIFALAHFQPWEVPYRFLLGLASGYTVYLTRSIWSGILMGVLFYAAEIVVELVPAPPDVTALTEGPLGMARVAAVVVAAAAVLTFAWRRERLIRDRLAERHEPTVETGSSD